jgi:PAS domain S-box-containing protein
MEQSSQQISGQTNHKAQILIADDVSQNLELLKQILVSAGYAVKGVHNGVQVLEWVDRQVPDLILLDIRMPEMDGLEVCRQLKARNGVSEVPVIFISGLVDAEDKIQGFNAGGIDYITKPFDRAEVLARVRTHLELQAMRRQLEHQVSRRTAELRKSNRALKMISHSNQILVRAADEPSLLQHICKAIVEVGGVPFCWVGCQRDEEDRLLVPAAFAAAGNSDGHALIQVLRSADAADLSAECRQAVEQAKPVVIPDLAASSAADDGYVRAALESGLTCTVSVPLIFDRRIYGVLNVLTDNAEMFEETEVQLLQALCEDLAFGIRTLRERSAHQLAQKALIESEQRYRQLFEKAGEAVFLMEARGADIGRIIQANQAAAQMHGYTVDELLGMSIVDLDAPDAATKFSERNRRMRAGEWIHQEINHLKKDGTPFTTEVSVGVIDIGDQQYILAFYRDITDRKRIEAENAALEVQIRQANKMEAIATLASGIAHDFNNILSAASGYTELSIPLVPVDSILSNNLHKIQQANKRAAELVRHILALSRQKESTLQVLQPRLIIKEAIRLLRASLPATIEIREQIDSDAYIMGDASQIHQIIMNLCVNAGHAMEENGGVLSICLSDTQLDTHVARHYMHLSPGPYVKLEVADTGHGIPGDILDKIFDPYFTTKPQDKGTGLGLAVVNGIVNSYRGAITVESQVDRGACFTLLFPAVAAEQGAQVESGEPIPRGSERILFVDDEPALVEIGQQVLQLLGYEVTTQTSSAKALKLFQENPEAFDLLVTDYTMPKMTGAQLAKFVLEINPNLPVILMSGIESMNLESEAKHVGVSGFLGKPVNIREIAVLVRQLLDRSRRSGHEQ